MTSGELLKQRNGSLIQEGYRSTLIGSSQIALRRHFLEDYRFAPNLTLTKVFLGLPQFTLLARPDLLR
jgi:hypothetical protein